MERVESDALRFPPGRKSENQALPWNKTRKNHNVHVVYFSWPYS